MGKKVWQSKTFWVNVLAIIGDILLSFTGNNPLSPELQVTILGVVNIVLRLITKDPIVWS